MKTPQELANSIKSENTLTEPALSNSNLSNEQQEKLNTSLLSSILGGNYGRTKELLDKGADVNTKDELGNTPILNAVYYYDAELVKLLIKAGADVNATAENPKYSIKYISKNMRNSEKYISESKRNLEIINSLIKAGVNPTEVDSKFTTDNNIIGLFKEAIDQKDSPSIANLYKHFSEFRMDALAYANSQNNSEMVQFINKIHDEAEPKKITQIQLDILIANNNYKNEINLKNLLEANHYLTDLSYLRINGDKFNQNLNKLDFSGLILSNSKLHNLSAREVLFVD